MKKSAIFALAIAVCPVHAEVFKCQLAEKTVYQSLPCPTTANGQQVLEIREVPPEKMAENEARLKEWESGFAAREAAEREAQAKKEEIEALRRTARAQEELAQRPIIINQTPVFVQYPNRFSRWVPPIPAGQEMHHQPADRYHRPSKTNW